MSDRPSAEEQFSALVQALAGRHGVELGSGRRGFGSDALQVDGRIFAMVSQGRVVLKLPRERVATLVASGDGAPFDAGKGRPMKEWVVVEEGAYEQLLSLGQEAQAFVSRRGSPDPET